MNFQKKSIYDTPNRPGRCLLTEKTEAKKSCDTVPLKGQYSKLFASDFSGIGIGGRLTS